MVCEGGKRNVVIGIQPESIGVALRSILLAVEGEFLWELA